VIHLPSGKDFTIEAPGNSAENLFVHSALLNGRTLSSPNFTHSDIISGSRLILNMSSTPTPNAFGRAN
jgi:putative alpha-1,2-mannosidase